MHALFYEYLGCKVHSHFRIVIPYYVLSVRDYNCMRLWGYSRYTTNVKLAKIASDIDEFLKAAKE